MNENTLDQLHRLIDAAANPANSVEERKAAVDQARAVLWDVTFAVDADVMAESIRRVQAAYGASNEA
jgi:hypothetical protein